MSAAGDARRRASKARRDRRAGYDAPPSAVPDAGPRAGELIIVDGVPSRVLSVVDHPAGTHDGTRVLVHLPAREWRTARGSRWTGVREDGSLFHVPMTCIVPALWAVSANVERTRDGWSGSIQIPTFFLDPRVQGILTADHAERVAREMLTLLAGEDAVVHVTVAAVES